MSLVATYFKATDGLYYGSKDEPRGYDEHGCIWFICFDDDDPPELVIKLTGHPGGSNREAAIELLKKIGMADAKIIEGPNSAQRCFENNTRMSFHKAMAFFLDIRSPIPVGILPVNKTPIDVNRVGDCVIYNFKD